MNSFWKLIKYNKVYILIYLMFIFEVIINLKSKYLWADESFTFHIIKHNFMDIIGLTAQDVHPFLYYFIGKVFTYNIQNTFVQILILRIVNTIPYLLLLLIGHIYIKYKYSTFVSKIFMFCIITMPLLTDNIYQLRMYGWAMLFTTICYILFIDAYESKNNMKLFLLISFTALLSAYTLYYALITVAILYISFLIMFIMHGKNIKYLITSIIIDVIIYFQWLEIILNQTKSVSNNFWSSELQLKTFVHMVLGIASPVYHTFPSYLLIFYILPLVFFIVLIIMMFNKNIKKDGVIIIGLLIPFLLILIGTILSMIVGHSLLMIRYATPTMGIFWLSFSLFIDGISFKHSILKLLLLILMISIGLLSYSKHIIVTNNTANSFNQTLKILKKIPSNSAIIYNDQSKIYSSSNYLQNNYLLNEKIPISYKSVYNNIDINNINHIQKKYSNIFYMKTNSTIDQKYTEYKIGTLNFPMDGGKAKLYKIR